jgi:hypothetical protein
MSCLDESFIRESYMLVWAAGSVTIVIVDYCKLERHVVARQDLTRKIKSGIQNNMPPRTVPLESQSRLEVTRRQMRHYDFACTYEK